MIITFVELLRLSNGIIQNQVRTTEYAVLEDTLAKEEHLTNQVIIQ